jgi:hypothetical protein
MRSCWNRSASREWNEQLILQRLHLTGDLQPAAGGPGQAPASIERQFELGLRPPTLRAALPECLPMLTLGPRPRARSSGLDSRLRRERVPAQYGQVVL